MKIPEPQQDGQGANLVRAPTAAELASARVRLLGTVYRTPVISLAALNAELGSEVVMKCEQFQVTGAFKARGATNAVRSLTSAQLKRGVATHSSGNHGAALAWAARRAGAKAWIVVPESAVASKRESIRRYGGQIVDCGPSQKDREARLAAVLAETGAIPVHPYDDVRVIAGQATATWEFLESEPGLKRLVVPVGGGGLASGAVLAVRMLGRDVDVIGVEPSGADDTRRSLAAGRRVSLDAVDTLADGLRAQVGEATFPILRGGLADLVTVGDEEILAVLRWALDIGKLVIEPSSAVVLAALFRGSVSAAGGSTGVILSGGNLDFAGEAWRRARLAGLPRA